MKQIVFLLACLWSLDNVSAAKQNLYVGGLFELSGHWFADYVNFFVQIFEHAFEEIENRTDLLADYSLKLITKDTQEYRAFKEDSCQFLANVCAQNTIQMLRRLNMSRKRGKNGLAARRMVEMMTEGPPLVAVLGPSLSPELTVVGQISPFYDIVHLSYVASTSSTVDRELFPTLFLVNQIMDDLNPLRIRMMQYFNWNRVGTIFFQDDVSTSQMNMFHDLLKQYNLTLVTSAVVSDNSDIKVPISRLLQYDVRIIMGAFRSTKAPRIFCEAYKQGLYGSNHVWILAGPVVYPNWIGANKNMDVNTMGCTYEQLVEATNGHFTLNYARIDSQNPTTISNQTPLEVSAILKAKLAETNYKLSKSYAWVYDTAWALAVGLNNSLRYLNESGLYSYTNQPYYLDAILKGMYDVNFAGISGPVTFDETGRRVSVTYIEQNFNDTRFQVAKYNHLTGSLTWFVPLGSLWPGGSIPQDSFTYHRVMVPPNLPSLVIIMLVNIACITTAVGFLAFNIYYRKNSNIKLSSPMINNVIIAGSILMFTCVLITSLDYGHLVPDSLDGSICMVRVWIMCLGFTTLFGALFSKTWRVHILFRDYKLKKTTIKDYHLFGIIAFLLLVDCLVLIPWSLTHRLQKDSIVRNRKDAHNSNNIISEVYTFCHHPLQGYWYVSIYIYKGLLLAFGTFLAYETRQVTIAALNDSKYIGFCIYNVVIVCIFGVPLTHVLPIEQTTLNFVLLSALVMFCTTMCLCILFIPKIKIRNKVSERFLLPSLNSKPPASSSVSYQNPSQNDKGPVGGVFTLSKDVNQSKQNTETSESTDEVKKENQQLRKKIASEAIAIARLKRELLTVTGNVHFYKEKDDYIVFKTQDQQPVPDETTESTCNQTNA